MSLLNPNIGTVEITQEAYLNPQDHRTLIVKETGPAVPFYSLQELQTLGGIVAKSKLLGTTDENQAVILLMLAQADKIHPIEAVRDYHIIQGKPSLKADAMLARFQKAGGKVEWLVYTDKEVTGQFYYTHGAVPPITWTWERAQKAGLTDREIWKKYPTAMLRARCVSEAIRAICPAVISGLYLPDEIEDQNMIEGEVINAEFNRKVDENKAKIEVQKLRDAYITLAKILYAQIKNRDFSLEEGREKYNDLRTRFTADSVDFPSDIEEHFEILLAGSD